MRDLMSDLMLHSILNMPITLKDCEKSTILLPQLLHRCRDASKRITTDSNLIFSLEKQVLAILQNEKLDEDSKLNLTQMLEDIRNSEPIRNY